MYCRGLNNCLNWALWGSVNVDLGYTVWGFGVQSNRNSQGSRFVQRQELCDTAPAGNTWFENPIRKWPRSSYSQKPIRRRQQCPTSGAT